MRQLLLVIFLNLWVITGPIWAQRAVSRGEQRSRLTTAQPIVLKPARVWDGVSPLAHNGWIVVVRGKTIEAAGPTGAVESSGNRPRLSNCRR